MKGRRILPDQSSDGWAAALRTQAQAMGLPVSIPLMDLDDNMAVNATDVWGRFADPILKASQRYGAEMVVLGKLTPDGKEEGKWSIDWGLYGPKAGGELSELTRERAPVPRPRWRRRSPMPWQAGWCRTMGRASPVSPPARHWWWRGCPASTA